MLDDMHKLVLAFLSRSEAGPFKEPVDWKNLGLFDYPNLIKHPMDLGTIKAKLDRNEYNRVEDAAADMRLVWTNCMTYNQDGSEYYQLADTFARKFEEKYAQIRRAGSTSSSANDPERIPSLDEKIQLSYDFFKIETTELGRVLTIIEDRCPSGLNKKDAEDEVIVNIDALTPSCFHEVVAFVKACTSSSGTSDASKAAKKRSRPLDAAADMASGGSIENVPIKKKSVSK